MCVFQCDVYGLSALFACKNKENISSWNTDWPLNGILAFFFFFHSIYFKKVTCCWVQWIGLWMQNATGKARTQCENPKLYIMQLTFWVPWMTGKSQLQRAVSLWSMNLCLADLWLLPDSVCIDCSMKDGTESRAWLSPLTSSFRHVLFLLCSCWARVFGLHGLVPIHIVKEQQCFFAWKQYCLGCILLPSHMTLLWDVVHKAQSFSPWARSAAGVFWSSFIIFDWYHLESWHSSAAMRNGTFPCHGTLWQHYAQRKETWIWNSPNNHHISQWQILERYKKSRF